MSDTDRRIKVKAKKHFEKIRKMVDGVLGESRSFSSRRSDAWEPPMDVYETHEAIVLKLSLAGIKASDVRIKYEDDVVTICGEREAESEPDLVAYHRMEIRNGYFERSVLVQKPVDPASATAEYSDGFLKVSIPKVKERKQRVYTLRVEL